MITCIHCGKTSPDDSRFCIECAKPVVIAAVTDRTIQLNNEKGTAKYIPIYTLPSGAPYPFVYYSDDAYYMRRRDIRTLLQDINTLTVPSDINGTYDIYYYGRKVILLD